MSAHRRGFRLGATGLALAALLLSATACGGTTRENSGDDSGAGNQASGAANPDAAIKEGLKIAFLPKQVNNPYFTVSDSGGKAAVTEIKGEYKEVGPSEASASSQVSYINTLSQQGMDVIVTSANDPNAICGALNQAKAAGAKIVTFDSDTKPECRQIFVNQVTAEGIAENQVKLISQQVGGEGEIAILSATANATNQNAWIALMKEELKKPEYSKLKLVTVAYGNDDDQKSFQETQGLLQSYPNLKGIISPTTVGVAAAARYLSGSQYKGKVKLTGLGTPNQMREFVKDGTVDGFALWNPADLGYLAAYAGAALASGQISGAEGEKFTAGKLGEYTVGKDGVVVLGPPTVFDKNNIDQFDF
ncbi:rhamnose ABC transporter substrate-binding protein [Micromonospora sp. WMMD812]|uniref:rhamnose ABC transporter substrate-binding protein n=1 Tax=Micromonospora sp. WMMD812 TaxID=3015152 RepID=UPI00248ADB87|nr:rhamnose ABC transporter substrate-binding protein [Micromonospora sp. WMMD812]WBB67919.1 rhamnose ABC transporter substrate-binding protein [Micromonospora sp. WMMD812]